MLTQKHLKELLRYDRKTGEFFWRVKHSNRAQKTQHAGHLHQSGYRKIMIDYKLYRAHRLAWLYIYGKFPEGDLDHINGDKSDCRIINLRNATNAQNIANAKRRVDNTSGYKGVSKHNDKWGAYITVSGKFIWLGYFPTPKEAHAAYCSAAKSLFGEFFNAGA